MPPLPARRPGQPSTLGDHEARIRALERSPIPPPAAIGALLVHAEGRYQIAGGGSVTVASAGAETIDWEHISGDALLDLTAPSAPTPVQSGWYTVDITYSSTSGVWTEGATYQAHLEFHGLQSKFAWSTVTIGVNDLPSGGDLGGPRQGFVSLSGHLRAGTDYIAFILANFDSISHDMTVDTAEVSMVYATA